MPQIIAVLAWRGEFHYEYGFLNILLTKIGLTAIQWKVDPVWNYVAMNIVNIWLGVPFMMVILLGGLQSIPVTYYEAADVDGASKLQQFWNITLPMLQPAFTTSVVLNLIGGLKLFDIIKVLTNGGPGYATNSISTYISSMYFDAQNAGYASALGVFLFILIAIITYLLNTGLAKLNWEA